MKVTNFFKKMPNAFQVSVLFPIALGLSTNIMSVSAQSLVVGQQLPALQLSSRLDRKTTIPIANLHQGKLLLISFWATWCVPCIHEMQTLDSLKRAHPDKFEVLAVTRQSEKVVRDFLAKPPFNKISTQRLNFIVADTILSKLFPYRVIPHNVWIDSAGYVSAITAGDEITATNILTFQQKAVRKWEVKADDFSFNFYKEFHHGDTSFSYRSIITPQIATGTNGVFSNGSDGKVQRFFQWNCSISHIFYELYSRLAVPTYIRWRPDLIELHHIDSTKILYPKGEFSSLLVKSGHANFASWQKANTFCYALTLPTQVDKMDFLRYAFDDMYRQFRIRGYVEHRKMSGLVITGRLKDKGGVFLSSKAGAVKVTLGADSTFITENATLVDITDFMMRRFNIKQLPYPIVAQAADNYKFNLKVSLPLKGGSDLEVPTLIMQAIAEKLGYKVKIKQINYPKLILRGEPGL
jgi:thiol-disulfide isomerase/thioredoxin